MTCRARQYGDTVMCGPCGVQWGVGDPDPPKCRKLKGHGLSVKLERLDESTAPAAPPPPATIEARIPAELPAQVARDMARAIGSTYYSDPVTMMRAAYRVFLDSLP